MKKRLLYLFLAGLFLIGGIGYYMYNKPAENIENVEGKEVTAAELCNAFAENEQKANENYANQVLILDGIVSQVSTNQDNALVVTIPADSSASVQCTMRDKDTKVSPGQALKIKGRFAGNDMFGVLLTDCILIK